MKLLVATGNKGKLREIRRLLQESDIEILGLDTFPDLPSVVEDRDSFEGNATKKACEIADATGLPCLADDSGLVVEALGGAPGIFSARYAGAQADDAANNAKLLKAMDGKSMRNAAFVCVMALVLQGEVKTFRGELKGLILEELRGEDGFGYDPLFLVPEYGKTLAEIGIETKNRISHRGQALRQVLAHLQAK